MDVNGNDRPQSDFNMAVSYLSRLNVWFFMAGQASANLEAHNWFHSLMVLFRELSTEMKEEEINERNKKNGKINDLIAREANNNKRNRTNGISPTLYNELHEFEMFLRKILKSAGLQTKMKDDFMKPEEQW